MKNLEEKLLELSRMLGEDLVVDLLEIFDVQMSEYLKVTLSQGSSVNLKQMSALSHKLKSSAMNVGAQKLGEILGELERKPEMTGEGQYTAESINTEYLKYLENLGHWNQKLMERKDSC